MERKSESTDEYDMSDTVQAYPRPKPRPMPRFEVTEDIVISGIAGRFPESDNMDEFADNLFKNIDMVTCDDRRWPTDLHCGVISRGGKIKSLDKFDNSFFSIATILADSIDAQSRLMLETTYEAICDAGVNPQTLRGTKTGVYVGINTVGSADGIPQDDYQDSRKKEAMLSLYGCTKPLYANRISFSYDFRGPSNLFDTACSASLVALVYAMNDIRLGVCDQAVIATANLTQAPFSSLLFDAANMISSDGKCKVWDRKADGFVRSETVGTIFLQKKCDAKRIYSTVLNAKTNTDGFKTLGIFSPFWLSQRDLMIETFQEAGVDPNDVKYFESHGTGTVVGDPQEAKAIADAFCSERRDEPLLVGAVKSNMGHSEGSSGINSVAKAIITFENQCIPANLHFEEPNPEIDVIVNKTLVPVVKNTPFKHNLIGVNSFGVGGVNACVLLRANSKEITPEINKIADIIPRLVNVCGRTEEAVKSIFDFIENNPNKANAEFLALLADVMKTITIKGSSNFPFRGYMIIKQNINQQNSVQYDYTRVITTANKKQSVWLAFTGMGSQWTAMAKTLMPIKTFSDSIERSAHVLKPYNIDLMHLLLTDDQNALNERITNPFVAITSMQIALYDIICLLNLKIEGIIGHSFGEIACAYADGCLTQEQAVLSSYWRGKVVENAKQNGKLPKGMLAAVGLSWQEIKNRCPDGIVAACHNGSNSVTISGLYDNMVNFLEQLNTENIFSRQVPGGDFPYHSDVMNIVAPQLLHALNGIIPKPKERSKKWITTSFTPEQCFQEKARYASGEYFTNNLVSPVYFNEGMANIETNSIVIEVAPHSLFESIFKRCFPYLIYSGLMKRTIAENLDYMLSSIGTLYTYGLNPDIENLYSRIEWPVSRGTQSISSLIKWDHERINELKKYPEYHNFSTASDYKMNISLKEADWSFLKDHTVEGKVLFPATGYIFMVWRRMAALRGQPWNKTAVVLENVRFIRATIVPEKSTIKFTIRISEVTGDFSITERSSVVCTGRVHVPEEQTLEMQINIQIALNEDNNGNNEVRETLQTNDIYKELRIRGYDYGPKFQGLVEARGDGKIGKARWMGHVISFMDSILHLGVFSLPIRSLFVPMSFQSVRIDPNILFRALETETNAFSIGNTELKKFLIFNESDIEAQGVKAGGNESTFREVILLEENVDVNAQRNTAILPVIFDRNMRSIITKGIEISGFIPVNIQRRAINKGLMLEKYVFIANNEELAIDKELRVELIEYIEVCCSICEQLWKCESKISKPVLNDYKCADESLVKRYLDSPKDNYKILKVLYNFLLTANFDENRNNINKIRDNIDLDIAAKDNLHNNDNNIELDLLKTVFTTERFIRPLIDIVIENLDRKTFKVFEHNPTNTQLATDIISTLRNKFAGFYNVDYTVGVSSQCGFIDEIKSFGLKINEWNISEQGMLKDVSAADLLIYRPNAEMHNCMSFNDQIKALKGAVQDNGFILLITKNTLTPPEVAYNELYNIDSNRETHSNKDMKKFIEIGEKNYLKIVAKKSDSLTSTLVLLRKLKSETTQADVINIKNGKYEQWVDVLKEKLAENLKANTKKNVWLVANDATVNGIIGLVNCLRKESGGNYIRCLFDYDNILPLPLDFAKSPYDELIKKDLVFNVYKDGEWGTYRHINLSEKDDTIMTEHAYLNIVTPGDFSSFKWFNSENKYFSTLELSDNNDSKVLINAYYSALNFKDIVLSLDWIKAGFISGLHDCLIGSEFVGRRSDNGKRVMGMCPSKGIATTIRTHIDYLWDIPDEWTLEEAATLPIVYSTAYYALIMRGGLQSGESVLIHSGAGGVGQAAINICQSLNCEIFVTVGTKEKREFIKNTFNIDDTHIGNSHNTSFEEQIMTVTQGEGVDIVLNSLTEDKLQASVRCLALNGRFLEIGKYDMQMNKSLGLFAFLKNISFHGVCLDRIFMNQTPNKKFSNFMRQISKLIIDGIANNVVKPIVRTVFDMNECEQAFRYMTTGKHIGKVLIKIRDEESEKIVVSPKQLLVNANTKTSFHPSKVYIINGGLGGMGLQLAYWMVMRGANKLVLTSRTGIKNPYQKWFLNNLNEIKKHLDGRKIEVKVSTNNAISVEDANRLIDEAMSMGSVGGIFNLSLVLRDGFMENQTVETFKEVCEPKLNVLSNLDVITQSKCPQLDYFVCFSSLTAGRGNSGQTNYGYANSAMERICELRRNKGLHGLAVQWGPIGDVGVIAEQLIDTAYRGDSLKVFFGVISQRISSCLVVLDRFLQSNYPMLSSIQIEDIDSQETKSEDQMLRELCVHLNIDKRSDNEFLGDIGLDSMMAVEIQQILERDFDISLSIAQIRKITVEELKELRDVSRDRLKQYSVDIIKAKANLLAIRWDVANESITFLNNIKTGKPVFILPPIEGIFVNFKELVAKINRPVIGINWTKQLNDINDFKKISAHFKQIITSYSPDDDFNLIVHSFGALIGFYWLRKQVPIKTFTFLDTIETFTERNKFEEKDNFAIMLSFIRSIFADSLVDRMQKEVMQVKRESERVSKVIELMREYVGNQLIGNDLEEIIRKSFARADIMIKYAKKNCEKLAKCENLKKKMIKKVMKHTKTDVTVIKLLKKGENTEKIAETIQQSFLFNNEKIGDKFTVHTIIGTEAEFLTTHSQKVSDIINNKLE